MKRPTFRRGISRRLFTPRHRWLAIAVIWVCVTVFALALAALAAYGTNPPVSNQQPEKESHVR